MALIKCPECGRDISDMASSCPGCGHVLRKSQNNKTKKNVVLIVGILIVLAIICIIWYQLDRSKKDNSSYSNSYYDSYYNYPKTGNEGALEKAKSYLNSSAFSYTGLIDQLEYNGFSESEAKYGADNCGANWKGQALKKAKSYLNTSAFSYTGLIDQLEYNGFTEEEAKYGADNCEANWKEQAAKKAKSYLNTSSFTRSELIDQLEYNGFTYEQAVYGVDQNGL